jgi:hypothetical protein
LPATFGAVAASVVIRDLIGTAPRWARSCWYYVSISFLNGPYGYLVFGSYVLY